MMFKILIAVLLKTFLPIFCHKDQMYVNIERTMPASSNVIDFFHRPKYLFKMKRLQAFKFEIEIIGQRKTTFLSFCGILSRFVYNKALNPAKGAL